MRRIVFIAPEPEVDAFVVQLGHAVQPPAFFQQGSQGFKFIPGMPKVFDHLAANDIVVGLEKSRSVGVKKRIVGGDVVAYISQQLSNNRPGARTVIQSTVQHILAIYDAAYNGIHKLLVGRIVHIVLMSEIMGSFHFQGGIVFFFQQYRVAAEALHIFQTSLPEVKEGLGGAITEAAFQGSLSFKWCIELANKPGF